jgi:hypothetical protein
VVAAAPESLSWPRCRFRSHRNGWPTRGPLWLLLTAAIVAMLVSIVPHCVLAALRAPAPDQFRRAGARP